jgi:hypothetical protein
MYTGAHWYQCGRRCDYRAFGVGVVAGVVVVLRTGAPPVINNGMIVTPCLVRRAWRVGSIVRRVARVRACWCVVRRFVRENGAQCVLAIDTPIVGTCAVVRVVGFG